MKKENRESIIGLVKIKKSHISRLKKLLKNIPKDNTISDNYWIMIEIHTAEIEILERVLKSEVEK